MIEVSNTKNGAVHRCGHTSWRGLATATPALAKSPSPMPLPLPFIHLQTTGNKIEVLFELLLHSSAPNTGMTSNTVRRRQRTCPGRPRLSQNRPIYKSTSTKTIAETIKFSNLSPYKPSSQLKSRRISNQLAYNKDHSNST